MIFKTKILLFVLLLSFMNILSANKYLPTEDDTLNYIHVLFKWDQVYNARAYQLQIAINDTGGGDPFASSLKVDLIDTTLLVIVTDSLDWGQAYVWRIRPLDSENDTGDWSTLHYFSIMALPGTIPPLEATMHDENKYTTGLYALDVGGTGYTVAFDQKGKPVHLLSTDDPAAFSRFRAFNWLPNGNILGAMSFGSPDHGAWEMTLDGDVVWSMTDESGYELHNEFLKLPNGNYMGMARRFEDGPIPDGPWKAALNDSGFTTTIPYLGDDIVEFDKNGTLVWSVNMFDLYDTADYDSLTWFRAASRGYYDWIHFNAIFYDEVEDMIYLSARHLSRITKLDHQTRLIVWNMGRNEFPNGISADVTVGTDLEFSMQHAIEVLENGNLIFYNNDNLSGEQTQALEIEVTQTGPTDPNPTVQIVWEYTLPDSLYTKSQGDADRLPDGNTLIAIANPTDNDLSGRLWEVDPDGNLVWRLVLGDGRTMFAAEKVPGLYAQAFSVIIPEFAQYPATPTIYLPVGEATLEFKLHNEGWLNETYDYSVLDSEGWFASAAGSLLVAANSMEMLTVSGNVTFVSYANDLELIISPRNAPDRAITISVQIWSIYSQAAEGSSELPRTFALKPAYPNPFNPSTTIEFELPITTDVTISIINVLGQQVRKAFYQDYPAGYHSFIWDAVAQPSGLYFIKMEATNFVQTRKVVLLK